LDSEAMGGNRMKAKHTAIAAAALVGITLGLIALIVPELLECKRQNRESFDRIFKDRSQQERDDLYRFFLEGRLRIEANPQGATTPTVGTFRKGE
jgi:hypothetical protein